MNSPVKKAAVLMPSDPAPSWGKMIVSLILRTLILLVVLETFLRLFGVDPRQALVNPEGPYIRHATRHWALKPNYSRNWAGAWVSINDKGLRDRPIDYSKPENELRILVLGGSVAFAYQLPVEKGYVFRLEDLLKKNSGNDAGRSIRSINSGVGGYSTFQELTYLKEEGMRFKPDVVILDFGLNDVLERYLIVEKFGGTGVYRGGKETEIELSEPKTERESWIRFLKNLPKKTAFYSLARSIKVRLVARKQGAKEIKDQVWMTKKLIEGDPSPKLQQAWKETLDELADWAAFTRSIGAKPVLLVFPDRLQVELGGKANRPQQLLHDFSTREKLLMVDLLPIFSHERAENVFLDEDHPTELGHEFAAKTIAEAFQRQGILQP